MAARIKAAVSRCQNEACEPTRACIPRYALAAADSAPAAVRVDDPAREHCTVGFESLYFDLLQVYLLKLAERREAGARRG